MNEETVLEMAKEAARQDLVLVIDANGKTRLRKEVQPGDTRIGVAIKEGA